MKRWRRVRLGSFFQPLTLAIVGLLFVGIVILYDAGLLHLPVWTQLYCFAPFALALTVIVLAIRFADSFPSIRDKRKLDGKCVRCGYDMRGTPATDSWNICPECGYKTPSFGDEREKE